MSDRKVMKKTSFLGIDVSKKTLDAALFVPRREKAPRENLVQVSNDEEGFRKLLGWLSAKGVETGGLAVCFENTGAYSKALCAFLQMEGLDYREENPLQIKRSIGAVRGKSDKADAWRIAGYCYGLRDDFRPTTLPDEKMQTLMSLRTERKLYVRECAKLKGIVSDGRMLRTASQKKRAAKEIERLAETIGDIEEEMRGLIESDSGIKRNYDLVTSVKGIGMVCALAMICTTHNFTRIPTARKMACYIGTAPFEYQSGTSVRGKTGVSHMAACEVKAELSQAAMSAIRCDPQIRQYYQRKRGEGKAAGTVLNAVKCKLLGRAYAVVKRGTGYVDVCKYAD